MTNKNIDSGLDRKLDKLAERCEQRSANAVFQTTAQDFKQTFFRKAVGVRPLRSRRALVWKIAAMAAVCLISLHIAVMSMTNRDSSKENAVAVMNIPDMAVLSDAQEDLYLEETAMMKEEASPSDAPVMKTTILSLDSESFRARPAAQNASVAAKAPSVQSDRFANLSESKKSVAASSPMDLAAGGTSVSGMSVARLAQVGNDSMDLAVAPPAAADASSASSGVMASKAAVMPEHRIIQPPYHPIEWPRPLPPIRIVPAQPENLQPVQVERGLANVKIVGDLAVATYEFVVANPNSRALEGQFEMPLPESASITGVALDINNNMVEASIVPKERAREVFEIIERQGVDPALVEAVGGNTYRTRIYPVPAKGSRRIRLQFVTKVIDADGMPPVLILPMRFENKLKEFALHIEIVNSKTAPRVETSQFTNLSFSNWQNVILAEQTITDAALPEDLRIALAKTDSRELYLEKLENDLWFHLYQPAPTGGKLAVVDISSVNLIWDASGSRENNDHLTEYELLTKWFQGKNSKIKLYLLRNTLEESGTYQKVDDLIAALKKVDYDGATNLSAIAPVLAEKTPCVLFGDGIDNYGPGFDKSAKINAPLAAVSVSSTAETVMLRFLTAQAPSGKFINLASSLDTAETLDSVLARKQFAAPEVKCDGQPCPSEAFFDNGFWEIAGKIPLSGKNITIVGSDGRVSSSADVKAEKATEGSLLKTRFGQLKLLRLQSLPGTTPEEYLELANEFRIVTPQTSMLVLDSVEQYIRYHIRPPESLPDFCAKYDDAIAGESKQKQKNAKDIGDVAARYQREIIDWYEGKVKVSQPSRRPGIVVGMANRVASAFGGGMAGMGGMAMADDAAAPMEMESVEMSRSMSALSRTEAQLISQDENVRMARSVSTAASKDVASEKSKAAASVTNTATKSIQLNQWKSDAQYLKDLEKDAANARSVYLKARRENASNAGFFVDCAQFFFDKNDKAFAVRVLSNLAELNLENRFLLRILGYKLRYFGEYAEAERVFRKVLKLGGEEAQSYRDLALTLQDEKKWQEAADMLYVLVTRKFDNRFPQLDLIAVTEINDIIVKAKRDSVTVKGIDERLIHPVETDLRITLGWDTDMSDMDLHIIDPVHEECFYGHRYTVNGGRISHDFTQGYGPEEFMVREALTGDYQLKAHYYGQRAQTMIGPVTLYAEVTTDFGRPNEKRETLTFRLASRDEMVDIGSIKTEGGKKPASVRRDLPPKNDPVMPLDFASESALPDIGSVYQLRANETLEDVAERFYNDRSKAEAIRELNSDKIRGTRIPAGTLLTLPPR